MTGTWNHKSQYKAQQGRGGLPVWPHGKAGQPAHKRRGGSCNPVHPCSIIISNGARRTEAPNREGPHRKNRRTLQIAPAGPALGKCPCDHPPALPRESPHTVAGKMHSPTFRVSPAALHVVEDLFRPPNTKMPLAVALAAMATPHIYSRAAWQAKPDHYQEAHYDRHARV